MRYRVFVPSEGTVTITVDDGSAVKSTTEQETAPVIVVGDTLAPESPNVPDAAPVSCMQTFRGSVTLGIEALKDAVSVIAAFIVIEAGFDMPV